MGRNKKKIKKQRQMAKQQALTGIKNNPEQNDLTSKHREHANPAAELPAQRKEEPKLPFPNPIFTILPIVISAISLVVSITMVFLQAHYAKLEYEYKMDPTFELSGEMRLQAIPVSDGHISLPRITKMDVKFLNINGLDRLFVIDPKYVVTEMDMDNPSASIKEYFTHALEGDPDLQYGNNFYYYRFVVFQGLDDDIDVEVFYVKTSPIINPSETVVLQFKNLSDIELIEFKKGHLNDENFEGEREIMKQYQEIQDYFWGND